MRLSWPLPCRVDRDSWRGGKVGEEERSRYDKKRRTRGFLGGLKGEGRTGRWGNKTHLLGGDGDVIDGLAVDVRDVGHARELLELGNRADADNLFVVRSWDKGLRED